MTTKMKKWHVGANKRRSKYKNRTVGKRLRAKRGTKHNYTKRGGVLKCMKKFWPWCNRQQSTPEEAHTSGPVPVVGGPGPGPVVLPPPPSPPSTSPTRSRPPHRNTPQARITPIDELDSSWNMFKLQVKRLHDAGDIPHGLVISKQAFSTLRNEHDELVAAYAKYDDMTKEERARVLVSIRELNKRLRESTSELKTLISSIKTPNPSSPSHLSPESTGPRMPL